MKLKYFCAAFAVHACGQTGQWSAAAEAVALLKQSISCQFPLTEVQLLTNVINVTTNYLNISNLSTLCTALLFQTRPHTTQ